MTQRSSPINAIDTWYLVIAADADISSVSGLGEVHFALSSGSQYALIIIGGSLYAATSAAVTNISSRFMTATWQEMMLEAGTRMWHVQFDLVDPNLARGLFQ